MPIYHIYIGIISIFQKLFAEAILFFEGFAKCVIVGCIAVYSDTACHTFVLGCMILTFFCVAFDS